MKKLIIPSIIASFLLVGCGGGGGGGTGSSSSLKEVKDIDAYIADAKICEGKGNCAFGIRFYRCKSK